MQRALLRLVSSTSVLLFVGGSCAVYTSGLRPDTEPAGSVVDGSAPADPTQSTEVPDAENAPSSDATRSSETSPAETNSSDASALDATPADASDAGADAPFLGDTSPPHCDGDGDGFLAKDCGGDDCCDGDGDAYPGQTNFFARQSLCGGWDYDCDGTERRAFDLVSCERRGPSCDGDGFASPAECGVAADFYSCEAAPSGCLAVKTRRLQRCR